MKGQEKVLIFDEELRKGILQKAADEAIEIIKRNMKNHPIGYPAIPLEGKTDTYLWVEENGDVRCNLWTEGFWPGQIWLAYELTKEDAFKERGTVCVEEFLDRVIKNRHIDSHHDTGFLYSISCISAYMLTGNENGKKAAELAAYSLSRRFRERGEFIQSSGNELQTECYRFIADTIMNLPLLIWASETTGDKSYFEKAIKHASTTVKYLMREDGSSYHHFLMDYFTGGPVRGLTWQGAGDETCWSRGQAWLIYGFAILYAYTGNEYWVEQFYKVTDYFIDNLPDDYVPYWDFSMTNVDGEPRDTSAAAVMCCGIMEMANHLPADSGKMKKYVDVAKKSLLSLIENYAAKSADSSECLLYHVTPAKPQGSEDTCANYGDYFYMEALTRALVKWKMYW